MNTEKQTEHKEKTLISALNEIKELEQLLQGSQSREQFLTEEKLKMKEENEKLLAEVQAN